MAKHYFFDWLMTSFVSVIEILKCQYINAILNVDNICNDINEPYHNDNSRIVIKSLDFCVSIHDLYRKYSRDDLLDFIEKYKRRFNRIIVYIKSNEHIIFIKQGETLDRNKRDQFIEAILKNKPFV